MNEFMNVPDIERENANESAFELVKREVLDKCEWKEVYQSSLLRTKADKARAVTEVGRTLIRYGAEIDDGKIFSAHELQHAIADDKPGRFHAYIGKIKDNPGHFNYFKATYAYEGPRTPKELMVIAIAPSGELSQVDADIFTINFFRNLLKRK